MATIKNEKRGLTAPFFYGKVYNINDIIAMIDMIALIANQRSLKMSEIKKFAVSGTKGGIGKSTIATQLSVLCTLMGKKVIFIDRDPQQSATHYFLAIEEDYRPDAIYHHYDVRPSFVPDVIIIDYPPYAEEIPPKGFTVLCPTRSTRLDLQSYRKSLELVQNGYDVIKIINDFSLTSSRDKALLDSLGDCCIISRNAAISSAMDNGKTIWNSGIKTRFGKRAKNQFYYLYQRAMAGSAEQYTIEQLKALDKFNIPETFENNNNKKEVN